MFNVCVCGALMRPLQSVKKSQNIIYKPSTKHGAQDSKALPDSSSQTKGSQESDKNKPSAGGNPISKCIDVTLLKDPLFLSFSCGLCFMTMSYMAAQMLLPDLGKSRGIPTKKSVLLLSLMGISDSVGRITAGILFDIPIIKRHRKHYYSVAVAVSALTCFLWAASTSFVALATISVIHGLFIGMVVSQRMVIVTDLLGVQRLSNTFGLTVFFQGIGLMVGPSVAGNNH